MLTFDDVVRRFERPKRLADGSFMVRCPCHDDKQASLHITQGSGGSIVMKCHAGCATDAVMAAKGLEWKDITMPKEAARHIVAVYPYRDENGNTLYETVRYEPKDFRQRVPDGAGGYTYSLKGVRRVLYNLPAVIEAIAAKNHIMLCEGEKDADKMNALGIVATSSPMGAGKFLPEYAESLRGALVDLLPDNDPPGREHMQKAAAMLHGVAKEVRIIDPCTIMPDLPPKGDISDILQALGAGETIKRLVNAVESAPQYQPPECTSPKAPEAIKPKVLCLADYPYIPPEYVIPPYFQQGKINVVQGDPGSGKTTFTSKAAACMTTGQDFLGIPVKQGNIGILNNEDDIENIAGRIRACGGDLTKVFMPSNSHALTFSDARIEQFIAENRLIACIFDPYQAYLGARVDMNTSNETRPVLGALAAMAKRTSCAIIIIAHLNKDSRKQALYRSLGSVDLVAASRSVLHVDSDPESASKSDRVMLHVKSSNAPAGRGVSFRIIERGGAELTGFNDFDEVDLVRRESRDKKGVDYGSEPLVQIFRQALADNPGGGFFSYAELKEYGMKLLGFPPFSDSKELKTKLTGGFERELMQNDGILVVVGAKYSGVRGVKVERYVVPSAYATKLGVP